MPYTIGLRHQAAVRQLAALGTSEALPQAAGSIAAFPSLHDALIARIVELDPPPDVLRRIAGELAKHDGWTADHRHRIRHWVGVDDGLHAFPRGDLALAWRTYSWRKQQPLPAALFLTTSEIAALQPAELSDEEELFIAHRLFASNPDSQPHALRLLEAAVRVQAESVIVALFESGRLTPLFDAPPVIAAFHALPWSRFGLLKQRLCAQLATSDPRLHALALWARGDHAAALEAYGVGGDPVMVREYLVIAVSAHAKFDPALLETLGGYEAEWLRRLTSSPSTFGALTELVETPLPPADDPLFAMAVAFMHRQIVRKGNTDALAAALARNASAADPSWRRHLPHVEREYADAWAGIRASDSAALAAATLDRLLLLPVDGAWLALILPTVIGLPPEWFATEEDVTTPMSDVAVAICIRVIEQLLAAGHQPDVDQQRSLCSGLPFSVLQTTLNILDERGNA